MKLNFCKQYFFIILLFFIFSNNQVNSSNNLQSYSKENISNYFLGTMLINQDYDSEAFRHLSKIQSIKKKS